MQNSRRKILETGRTACSKALRWEQAQQFGGTAWLEMSEQGESKQ